MGPPASGAAAAERFFAAARPRYFDLLSHVATAEGFLVDGDALLHDCADAPRLDGAHGGQPLHLAYLAEQVLHGFVSRGAEVTVVFFAAHEALWHDCPWKLLARRALVAHLKRLAERTITVRVEDGFDNWWGEDWTTYVHDTRPAFMLLTDVPRLTEQELAAVGLGPDAEAPGSSRDQARQLFRGLATSCLCQLVHVAFLPELEFRDTKVFGFLTCSRVQWQIQAQPGREAKDQGALVMLDAGGNVSNLVMPLPPTRAELAEHAAAVAEGLPAAPAQAAAPPDVVLAQGEPNVWRARATAASVAALLAGGPADGVDAAVWGRALRLLVVHEACLGVIPLRSRAQPLEEEPTSAAARHAGDAHVQALGAVLAKHAELLAAMPLGDTADALDAFDGRLLHSVAALLLDGQPSALPAAAAARAEAVWAAAGGSGALLPVFPDVAPAAAPPVAPPSPAFGSPGALLSVRGNTLVDEYLKEVGTDYEEAPLAEVAAVRRETHEIEDRYRWSSETPFEPAFWEESKDKAAGKAAINKAKPLEELAFSDAISKAQRRRLRNTLERAEFQRDEKRRAEIALIRKLVNKWIDEREQRALQLSARYSQWYAASLTGTKFVRGRVITKGGPAEKDAKGAARPESAKPKKGGKESKKDQIIREAEEKKKTEELTKQRERWVNMEGRMNSVKEWNEGATVELKKFLATVNNAPEVALDTVAYLIEQCLTAHKTVCALREEAQKAGKFPPEHSMRMAVHIWEVVQVAVDKHISTLADEDKGKKALKAITKTLEKMGFDEASAAILKAVEDHRAEAGEGGAESKASESAKPGKEKKEKDKKGDKEKDGKDSKKDKKEKKEKKEKDREVREPDKRANCKMSAKRFEMQYAGHLMPRPVPPGRDPRAESFNPDQWQRNLLDLVDRGESSLVCAPTSSGKTFISSYIMERVMRSGDEGRVVFVAPTKALVNQVAAQVYKDFGPVYGVFTRDYRHDALESRILVTVPACLEILLLAPEYQDWARTLKYVIFDEIHCIGENEGGEVWEHLLLLLRCPFLALSATVGEPQKFADWLAGAKALQEEQDKAAGTAADPAHYRVTLIEHKERYADLRSHVFVPPKEGEILSLDDGVLVNRRGVDDDILESARKHAARHVCELHPASCLNAKILRTHGFPTQLDFEPRDCMLIYDNLRKAAPDPDTADLVALAPEAFFAEDRRITRPRARVYERELKRVMTSMAQADNDSFLAVEKTLAACSGGLEEATRVAEEEVGQSSIEFGDGAAIAGSFVDLLVSLGASDRLPAIVFNFDRFMCMELLAETVKRLEEQEEKYNKAHARELQAKEAALERALKAAKKERDKKKTKDEEERDAKEDGPMIEEEGPVNRWFTFVREGEQMVKQELEHLLKSLRMEDDDILIRALHRGIGVHHSGLPKKYRQAVEILFRARHLKVVIATNTLAYGINMPCRSVVFAGDSIFFDALHYRQMAGRAGRRGFDDLGHVVFFAVPGHKISRLLVSPVPQLRGRFPLSTTFVLRVLQLMEHVPKAQNTLLALLERTHIAAESEAVQPQLQHYFRHMVEYLQRHHMLDGTGSPHGLALLAGHIFWSEPANLALCALLERGLVHTLTDPSNTATGEKLKREEHRTWLTISGDLLLMLAHVFGREPMRRSTFDDKRLEQSPSKVILEPLPDLYAEPLRQHNAQTLESFVACVRRMAESEGVGLPEDASLPLSDYAPCVSEGAKRPADAGPPSDLAGVLAAAAVDYSACSPFAALSGKGDDFGSAQELSLCARKGLAVQLASIPVLNAGDRHGRELPLNRHVLDYFKHGNKGLLTSANGIPEGDAWEILHEFLGVIKSVAFGLQQLSSQGEAEAQRDEDEEGVTGSQLVAAFKKMAGDYAAAHDNFNVGGHSGAATDETAAAVAPAAPEAPATPAPEVGAA